MASSNIRLFDDESIVTLQSTSGRQLLALAVDPIDVTEQVGLRIRSGCEPIVRTRQVLTRGRANHVGRDDHDQLGFALGEVPAAEQRAEHGYVLDAGQAVDV